MKKAIILVLIFYINIPIFPQRNFELNTILMNATFRIEGSSKTGTVFIIGKPSKKDSTKAFYVMVTANHVLDDIKTDLATLYLRKNVDNNYSLYPYPVRIRNNGTPLWTKNPDADVAAMYIALPHDISIELLTTDFLATDSLISKFEIHPGDELFCLGYPYGVSANEAGFPILRSGIISSYPLLPTREIKSFLFDFQVFGGNSGGPVYFIGVNRDYKGGIHIGSVRFIIGLVSKQKIIEEEIKSLDETTRKEHALGLAIVIPATFIRDTINLLPNLDK